MYQSVKIQEYYLYNKKCKLLLQESEIRFAGFLDSMGNLIAGGYKQGITPLHDESQRRMMYIDAVLRTKTQQDYDSDLGQMEYSVSRRRKVIVFTFEIDDQVLFISTEPTIDIEKTAQKIMSICKI